MGMAVEHNNQMRQLIMRPSQKFWGMGTRAIFSGEHRQFWGIGNIKNQDFVFGNKAIFSRGTREQVPRLGGPL